MLSAAHAQQNGAANNTVYPALQHELQRAQRQRKGIPLLPAMDIVGAVSSTATETMSAR
jgi:hypothetical protein